MGNDEKYVCNPLMAFQQGLLTSEEYKGFLKGYIIKHIVCCDESDDPLMEVDKAIQYVYELYYLIGSEQLGVSVNGFKDLSELTRRNDKFKGV